MLREFIEARYGKDCFEIVRADLIGENLLIEGPAGKVRLIYADYAASGRALSGIEFFVHTHVLPYYANAHTEASFCGGYINGLRRQARAAIAELCGAGDEYAVIFTGAGATAGLNRLARMLTCAAERPLILVGPYEHHSNLLPWRESGAEVLEIPEAVEGGPDCAAMEEILGAVEPGRRIVGAFSAASNVTGIVTDVARVNALLKRHGALTVWDFASGAPYLPIDMGAGGGLDAVVFSPHKFLGGPAASGVTIVRRAIAPAQAPSITGGGAVSFVSPWAHRYAEDLGVREEAGSPNVIGDIRAALAMLVKAQLGQEAIAARNAALTQMLRERWGAHERIEILGNAEAERLPICSFRLRDGAGGYVHHQLVTRMLSDYYGVQARGGCACAGPYAHRLLGLSKADSEALWRRIEAGHELEKPGWTRINLCPVASDESIGAILGAVIDLAVAAPHLAQRYTCDARTARFRHTG